MKIEFKAGKQGLSIPHPKDAILKIDNKELQSYIDFFYLEVRVGSPIHWIVGFKGESGTSKVKKRLWWLFKTKTGNVLWKVKKESIVLSNFIRSFDRHKQKEVKIGRKKRPIDLPLADFIYHLNKVGIKTESCCKGKFSDEAYVTLSKEGLKLEELSNAYVLKWKLKRD